MRPPAASLVVFTVVTTLLVSLALSPAAHQALAADAKLVQIESTEVRVSPFGPVVLLKVQKKAIPIFVDAIVAESIHGALTGEKFARPLSHDLMRSILEGFDGKVSRVVITLKGATYYADMTVVMRGTTKVFDSRSSDAIALAIHFKAPLFVSQELIDKAGTEIGAGSESRPGGTRL
jgi:bifunctional DNase/RNase